MKSKYIFAAVLSLGTVLSLSAAAHAQVTVKNSPDTVPNSSSLSNMNLSTLLANVGITSNLTTDQITERAFSTVNGFVPRIDVLFADNVRTSAAGYKPYHRIGWYQRQVGAGVPAESGILDVAWESAAYVNNANTSSQKLTTTNSDFASLTSGLPFELRLSSATTTDQRGGSVYGNDAFNPSSFRNIAYFKERDSNGNLVANSYIVAWEDQRGGGDEDYQDMVIRVKYVTAVNPVAIVPESSSLALLGTGILALPLLGAMFIRRIRKSGTTN